MRARESATAADMYKTDMERYLFAPTRRPRRRKRSPIIDSVGDWLRDWILGGWSRWQPLAGAAN
jgi:transposase